jgi:hypothetical protein
MYLNFNTILENYPIIVGCSALIIFILLIVFIRMQMLPLTIMRLIKGGFLFSVGFMIMYLGSHYLPISQESKWEEVLCSSYHQYVEVLEDNSSIFEQPSLNGSILQRMPAGHLLLQTDYRRVGDLVWNKVLLNAEEFGWIVNVSPPQMGVPEKIVSREYKFYFRYKDLYAFIVGFIGFIFGFWRFRIRPI